MSSMIGQTIDRYQILSQLGEGGMATVYKAFDTRLEREVAIKVIRRGAFPPEQLDMILARFEREAKSLAKLSHPNIVGVIDYGEFDGAPYLVMVYLSGGTLKEKLGKPIPWRESVGMILPIARALEYVHEHNIINRDVKPSNILLTEKDQPMLTDFGLVKLFEGKESNLTASGAGIGTPDYMAPEQWTGETTTLSDMYSLGVVLYEMVTGYRPYVSDTPAGVLLKQVNEPLPLPNQYIPDLPKNIESVLLKVLARNPADRYPNMNAFAYELQTLFEGREPVASTIQTEKLREQMTGKVKKEEIAETRKQIDEIKKAQAAAAVPAQPAKEKSKLPLGLIAGGGIIALLLIVGAIWMFSRSSDTPAAVIPTQAPATVAPTSAPTEAPLPTETPIPAEITDASNTFMRLIPAGEFIMGSDDGPVDTRPQATVNLEPFYIDKYEVSNDMYAVCVKEEKCRRPLQGGSFTRKSYYGVPEFGNHPVLYVDWKMANAYCAWRDARLPTEAEWEKAARGTEGNQFPWGNGAFSCELANRTGCVGDTAPVNIYDGGQSAYGVYGMTGNVWEWTSTLYKLYPYNATDGREDLTTAGNRVMRGGSWNFFGAQGDIFLYTRNKADGIYSGAYVGFRCAVSK